MELKKNTIFCLNGKRFIVIKKVNVAKVKVKNINKELDIQNYGLVPYECKDLDTNEHMLVLISKEDEENINGQK